MIATGVRLLVVSALLAVTLGGCGFRLAGSAELPPELGKIQLLAGDLDRHQRAALSDRLKRAGAEVSAEPFEDAVRLSVAIEAPPDRRVVASSQRKTVNRVTRQLTYSLRDAKGKILVEQKTLTQQGDVTVSDDDLLSSSGERQTVIDELERSLFDLLLRQLARV